MLTRNAMKETRKTVKEDGKKTRKRTNRKKKEEEVSLFFVFKGRLTLSIDAINFSLVVM